MKLLAEIIENQKRKLKSLTFYDMLKVLPGYAKAYVGFIIVSYGVHMYDAGQYLPFVVSDPRATSLFIFVLLGCLMAR